MPTENREEHEQAPAYSAQQVRQGDIVLRKPWQRRVFIAGLVATVVLAIVLMLVGAHFGRVYDRQLTNQQTMQDNSRS